jgi:hypothetical protein
MKYLLLILSLSAAMQAQNFAVSSFALPDAPSQQRPFWTVENKIKVSILAGLITADAITTQRGLNQGLSEVNPIMRPDLTRSGRRSCRISAGFWRSWSRVPAASTHHYKASALRCG